MTADERPTPPRELDQVSRDVLEELAGRDVATLRAMSSYLEDVATWKARRTDDGEATSATADPDAYPDDVPDRASVSVTEIGGTEYYYYQWREDDEIRSRTEQR
ncbi:hypothetical protein [Natrinema ejinorense]|uniref:Uncharacterized protein n=1 Tax=Natrinema ejinorense TaxID=373386 RepID=A0A2A5QWE7_9EURY|nr:hypothetical protein [Natrinema ejinorense]PCR91150.1 hypothetical protein CP557_11815 [Natrinema ejinorense]